MSKEAKESLVGGVVLLLLAAAAFTACNGTKVPEGRSGNQVYCEQVGGRYVPPELHTLPQCLSSDGSPMNLGTGRRDNWDLDPLSEP